MILHALFFTGLVFLFAGGTGPEASRSVGDLWNMGHVALFILFVIILYTDWKSFKDRPLPAQWALALILSAALAFSTELIQTLVERNFDLMDILRDLAGSVIGMMILGGIALADRKAEKYIRISVIGALLVITSFPLVLSLADEYTASRQFPLLAGFETPLEIERWWADGEIEVTRDVQRSGRFSLRVQYTRKKYSRLTMTYSLGDWSDYGALEFSFFNPDSTALEMICRIHDDEHRDHDNAYSDRFHRKLVLGPGWNRFVIPMADIRNAPSSRKMNLDRLEAISFFTVSLPEPRIVYLDDLLLSKKSD